MLTQALRAAIRDKLQPSQLLALARSTSLESFMASEPTRAVMLVRLDDREPDLRAGLVQHYGPAATAPASVGVLEFRTAMADVESFVRAPLASDPQADMEALGHWMRKAPCFPVPIVKQGGTFADRITIGRALNKDVVLRSSTVSKSHAWIERDEAGRLQIADAGSRNGTFIAGTQLEPRALHLLADGAELRIGRIEATVCGGEAFWHLAQAY